MQQAKWKIKSGHSGFTLVELLIVTMLSSLLLTGVVMLFTTASRTYSGEDIKASARQDARAAFDLMVTELTMAGFNPTQSANFTAFTVSSPAPIGPTIDATQIRIFMDLPPDAVNPADGVITTGSNEDITYSLNGTDLQRNGQTVIPNVTNLSFTYRDSNGVVTATAADIRQIDVTMTVQASAPDPRTPGQPAKEIILTTIVLPRNLLFMGT
ncbi:MAG TPA: prepilin-type N-terminal cleavage/methylation domain-containing protein [Proteobacteria bacterium]|nr:prepilin-type N-terminal cleavage/methylation domain-containing protein [Pseudomonadota bacterium]